MRYAAGIEYQGTAYAGWQHQGHARTVQGELEAALSRVADHAVGVVAAGRTDAGVHAVAQVVHFDSDAVRTPRAWCLGSNSHLPPDIAVRWVHPVADDFHARFSAEARSYRYVIVEQSTRPALLAGRVTWVHHTLDAAAMHAAAQALVGEHDFSAYRAMACQSRSPRRRVDRLSVTRSGLVLGVDITANAFLHHMVRNIVGVLLEVGRGERAVGWAGEVLAGRDRSQAGVTAPPDGLYLTGVRYPARFGLPADPGTGVPGGPVRTDV